MVNKGPSTACDRCRSRSTKCDKARPHCGQCQRQGITCPGYRDVGGMIIKDVSQLVVERQQRRAKRIHAGSSSELIAPVRVELIHSRSPSAPSEIRLDARATAIQFFFAHYVPRSDRQAMLSRGHFDHLERLYANASENSALALATQMMATHAMNLCFDRPMDDVRDLQAESVALQALSSAIASPSQNLRDETLLAALCFDYTDHLKSRRTGGPPSTAHASGMLMLIQYRGRNGFDTAVGRSLLAAARSNIVLQNFWRHDPQSIKAIETLPDTDLRQDVKPFMLLHHILTRVIQTSRRGPEHQVDLTQGELQELLEAQSQRWDRLDEQLMLWYSLIPDEWQTLLGQQYLAEPRKDIGAYSPRTQSLLLLEAYVCGQFLCIRLMVQKFLYVNAGQRTAFSQSQNNMFPTSPSHLERAQQEILRTIQQLAEQLFGICECIKSMCKFDESPQTLKDQQVESILRVGEQGSWQEFDALDARTYVLSLTRWVFSIMSFQIPGTAGFKLSDDSMSYLRSEFTTLSRLSNITGAYDPKPR